MSFSSDVDFHRFTLGFLLDWKQGGDIINLTEFLYDAGQNSKDYRARGGADRIAPHSGRGSPSRTSRTARYVKLREVNLSYNLPERLHPAALRTQRSHGAALAHRAQPAPVHPLPRVSIPR